jgi:hypothetical protein
MRRLLVLLSFSLFFSATLRGQESFYVDKTNGNDSNTGTSQEHSWKTIQKACNSAGPGDTVYIKGGIYAENVVVGVSGTAAGVITFRNFGNDVVVLDGTDTSGNTLLDITDHSHLVFENLTFRNLLGPYAKGISVESENTAVADLTFRNITIHNIGWTGDAQALPTADDNAYPFKVKGNGFGIVGLVIDGCHIYDNITGFSEALSINGNVDGFVVSATKVHDNTNIGIDIIGNYGASADPQTDLPRNGVIRSNTCYRNVSQIAESAGIYIDGGRNIVVERNNCHENGFGIEVGCEQNGTAKYITVKNNIIYNNRSAGLHVGGYTTETTGEVLYGTFRHNTLFQNNALLGGASELAISKASYCVFEDNIFFTNAQHILWTLDEIAPQQGNLVNYNLWYTPAADPDDITVYLGGVTFHSFADYTAATDYDSNSAFGTPGFLNATLPQPSLMPSDTGLGIDAGNPVLALPDGEMDFDGSPRLSGPVVDMGAREFQHPLAAIRFPGKKSFVYPNPFTASATVYVDTAANGLTLAVFDLSGRQVMSENLTALPFALHRGNLSPGCYVYRITSGGAVISTDKFFIR